MRKQAITLGRIGILLPIAAIIPFLGTLAGLAVMILLLFSHYYFSKIYEKKGIFNNALIGTIITVAANLLGGIILTVAVGSAAFTLSGGEMESFDFQNIREIIFESGLSIFGVIIMIAGLIVGYYFIFNALKTLAQETGIKYFKTAGLLYFIGSIAVILFFVGFLVMFVAWILHIVAYFSIQPEEAASEPG